MINKIFKIIHNKFYGFFKFIFFIRYLFAIFFVAIVLFVTLPQLFDYTKKTDTIKNYLYQNYGISELGFQSIKYKAFPTPHLQINNLISNIYMQEIKFGSDQIKIFPEILSLYNYENFKVRKIKFYNNSIEVDIKDVQNLIKHFSQLDKKIFFKDLDFVINDKKKNIIELNSIDFLNYGYNKNIIDGEVFNKKFKIDFNEDLKNINFKLIDTGINASLTFKEKLNNEMFSGNLKGEILKSKFKINFTYEEDVFEINDLFFRDKNLSFDSKGYVKFNPYFLINLISFIKNIDTKYLQNFNINEIFKFKKLIKKINSENRIIFKAKKFSRNTINDLNIDVTLAYGRLNFLKNISIFNSSIVCRNRINLLDDYPIFYFNCSFNTPNIQKFLKKININQKINEEIFDLKVKGNLNVLNNKISFEYIKLNESYVATKEDLKYFKNTFESILFDKNFIKIFDISKIRNFILEIS